MNKKLNRLWRQMTADKKRFGIMLTLVAVGLLLWGRLMLLEKVPRVATADDPDATTQPADPGRAVPQVRERPTVELDLSDDLALDLFVLRPDRYRPNPEHETDDPDIQGPPERVDELDQRAALRDAAQEMTLQGVVEGNPPFAVIDGVRVYVGDTAHGFMLTGLSVRHRKVRLTSEQYPDLVVILEMSNG